MPLAKAYDKLIDSKNADMKNIGGRLGGAITGAQFIQRFIKDTPWAHLDVAGTAMDSRPQRHQPELGARAGACACSTACVQTTTKRPSARAPTALAENATKRSHRHERSACNYVLIPSDFP